MMEKIQQYTKLYLTLLLYSVYSVLNKFASGYRIGTVKFFLLYGAGLIVLVVYAYLWQKVLSCFELSVAYANKPITILLNMIWGILFFHETISWNMVIGAIIIFVGVLIVVRDNGV